MLRMQRFAGFFALLLIAATAVAQVDQGRISGTVKDSQGGIIQGASVTITNEGTGDARMLTSSANGLFVAIGLAPGKYALNAKSEGFATSQFEHVPVGVGQERTLDVILQPASVEASVTVDGGEMVLIDTTSARVGTNIGEREVDTIPLNGRQLSQLYLMAPGAVTTGGGAYENIRFSGRATEQNAIRYDGVEGSSIIDSAPGNLNGQIPAAFRLQTSLENVQEFRVESSNYPAEYGTGSGGQVSVITKSGTNQLHGAVFEYLRNDALDARNFFDKNPDGTKATKSPLRMNQFGGSLGGPLQKDKAFFFLSYEGLRQRVGVPIVEQVPSLEVRSGIMSGAPVTIDPAIQPILQNVFPVGTAPTSDPNFDFASINGKAQVDENAFGIRFDYALSSKYSANLRYFRDQGESFNPSGVTGNGFSVTSVPQNGVLGLQQVLTANILNETKFGFNGAKTRTSGFVPNYPGVDLHAAVISIGGVNTLAASGGSPTGIATPSGLVRANSATNGRGQPYTNYTLSFIDNLSWIKDAHTMKFGVEVRPVRMKTDRLGGTTYNFSNLAGFLANNTSGVSFAGDLSAADPWNGGVTGMREPRQEFYIGYAQDEWKLRPNLTMSYGLRWEYYSVMREAKDRDIVFDTVNGRILPSDTSFYKSSKKNFGPRLAFSWSPERMHNKTVARIGAGYYYGPGQAEDLIQPIESVGVSRSLPAGTRFPIDTAAIIAGFDINNPTLGFAPRAYDAGYVVPERILSYTASVQQELPGGMVATVAYVGSQGRNLFQRGWTNRLIGVTMNTTTGAGSEVREFGPRFGEIDYKTSGGRDHYDALQAQVQRRLSRGFTTGLQWTWAHSIGTSAGSNDARSAQDTDNFNGERGNNLYDIRHSFNANALYELPFGQGKPFLNKSGLVNAIFGGWSVGGVMNARTGVAMELYITRNNIAYRDTRDGSIVNAPILVGGLPVTVPVINTPTGGASRSTRRPNVVAGVDPYLHIKGDKTKFLNPAAFSIPAPGTHGNLGRGALHGPGMAQFDLTLHKRFLVTEAANVEFRAEIYNLFNHANFAVPPSVLPNVLGTGLNQLQPGVPYTAAAAGAFGVITSTVDRTVGLGTQRQIQFSLRLNF